jgi:8-oxo-dGTP diphosphatase
MQNSKGKFTGKIIAALLQKDGKYFIARRTKKDGQEGLWEFPGGKQEEGETHEECLARELFEEFGIKAYVGNYVCSSFFILKDRAVELMAYKVTSYEGTITLNEHSEMQWVAPDELHKYAFTKPDLVFIEYLVNAHKVELK